VTFTADQLSVIMPANAGRATTYVYALNEAMLQFQIVTAKRSSAFIAQVAHESGELRYVREIGDGSQYEGRIDLGNIQPGDGHRYVGRGLIQLTGRTNYMAAGVALGLELIDHPELLEDPANAARSAAWFWMSRGLNQLADNDLFGAITKKINGGYNGLDSRLGYWLRARRSSGL
jgi:putative chitinase